MPQFPFGFWQAAGSPPPSSPTYGAEVMRTTPLGGTGGTQVYAFNASVSSGKRVVILVLGEAGQTPTSVTDDSTGGPNTWTVDTTNARSGVRVTIVSSQVTHAMTSANSITVTYDVSGSYGRGAMGFTIDNVTSVETSSIAATQNYGPDGNVSPVAVHSPSVLVGAVGSSYTNIPTNTTTVYGTISSGGSYNNNSYGLYCAAYYKNVAATGANQIGVLFTLDNNYTAQGVYYY